MGETVFPVFFPGEERGHRSVTQYPMVSPENMHTSNITQLEQVIRHMYVYTCHSHHFKRGQEYEKRRARRVCVKGWKAEREGRNEIIK